MVQSTTTSAPSTTPPAGSLLLVDERVRVLTAAVRDEFRTDRLIPPREAKVFHQGRCTVPACRQVTWQRPGLCTFHAGRWFHARHAGLSREQWLTEVPATPMPNRCTVSGCNFGRKSQGLCDRHSFRYLSQEFRPPIGLWTAAAQTLPLKRPPLVCRQRYCDLWRHGNKDYCLSHQSRWVAYTRQLTESTEASLDGFETFLELSSRPRLDLDGLPPLVVLETQYIFQTWLEHGEKRASIYGWSAALKKVRAAGVGSLLDRSATDWIGDLPSLKGQWSFTGAFFRIGCAWLDVLHQGSGWERQYPLDRWQLSQIGFPQHPKRVLDFSGLQPPWLTELAKRWLRHRIARGMSVATVTLDLAALQSMARTLSRPAPLDGDASDHAATPSGLPSPASFTRQHLERWLAEQVTRFPNARTRISHINSVRIFLRDVHLHEWATDLPASTMLHRDDTPRHTSSMPSRWIDEYVMTQIEDPVNLAKMRNPAYRLVIELMIRCGLRGGDALSLGIDALLRDHDGHPYLRYLNHKMAREAYVPVDDALADRLQEQRRQVLQDFPGTATKMFPGRTGNLLGTHPLTFGGFKHAFEDWLRAVALHDQHGDPVHVTPHQFRHTFGTRLINADVPQHIVQQLLDHVSPQMTNHYARLHDKTLREAWAKARKINAQGHTVELADDHPLAQAQWTRAGLSRAKQTLPNGYCSMPLQSDCEHANPCLTCPLFITTPAFLPQHEEQLRITLELIDVSQKAGHARIVEKNQQIVGNLTKIIDTCRGCSDGQVVVGGTRTPPADTRDSCDETAATTSRTSGDRHAS
ncbi:tyrosine-type recombinase/integrase [Kineococcus sp. SYSU DK018]|uniref:tyrosine-type recombinase/integrase n=1 Tax=Kineococcus sp. SYSU DK018 TaxID=3383139 RepID=UPI003D7CB01A